MTYNKPSEVTLLDRTGSYQFIGVAPSGSLTSSPVWQIVRITMVGNELTAVQWADGNENSDNIWDDRLTKSYS